MLSQQSLPSGLGNSFIYDVCCVVSYICRSCQISSLGFRIRKLRLAPIRTNNLATTTFFPTFGTLTHLHTLTNTTLANSPSDAMPYSVTLPDSEPKGRSGTPIRTSEIDNVLKADFMFFQTTFLSIIFQHDYRQS